MVFAFFGNKKPFKLLILEGLHPAFLALSDYVSVSVASQRINVSKAGLLTPPPVRRPSHLVTTKQWQTRRNGFLFAIRKGGVTAAGPFPIFTGFPIMPNRHL
jgi:hypothetical protein